ncbi:general secretion pathway protein H [Crinalium epipsammum PCC 9333]|uniref:General secretion pathway protein H n=1 Tax=Crinalium epipsammum PCC 9333 TaxID=1173022 RepID=K9W1H2_9CYAN|nr:type IV pilin-like G/H family protein [Crinalium epipsammum]AFZ14223.1 general secretion pathway protein H [Crinalium epipsammum PCC 9333]
MKLELQAKFLQHLNRKQSDKGFTLIELLVVIIIIGILAAIALPTFLNQTAKGKQSEAKNTVSAVNKSQTAYRVESTAFASDMSTLSLGLPTQTTNYTYAVSGSTETSTVTGEARDASLKGYSGANTRYTDANSQSAIASVLCENLAPGTGTVTVPTTNALATVVAAAASCPATAKTL